MRDLRQRTAWTAPRESALNLTQPLGRSRSTIRRPFYQVPTSALLPRCKSQDSLRTIPKRQPRKDRRWLVGCRNQMRSFTYVVYGLGRPPGAAAAYLALLTHTTVQISVYGDLLRSTLVHLSAPDLALWTYSLAVVGRSLASNRPTSSPAPPASAS